MFDVAILLAAAFAAGTINSVAGGGSFLTFPALIYVGVPPISANATSTLAVFPGYISGVFGFLRELRAFDRRLLTLMLALSVVGGILGAMLLLITPSDIFSVVIPWLLLVATLLFAYGDRIAGLCNTHLQATGNKSWFGILCVSVYGGYFNGGLGIILLALMSAMGLRDLKLMSGLKSGLSAILSASSVVTFTIAGIIHWENATIMIVAATIGGYFGAILVRRLPQHAVKTSVVVIGALTTLGFFLKQYA